MHLEGFPAIPAAWLDEALDEKWAKIRKVRRVVTGALEIERAAKHIGSSLESAPVVYLQDPELAALVASVNFADVCITSELRIETGEGPDAAFRLDDVAGVAVVHQMAAGHKCARSWRFSTEIGADPAYPDVTPRDAAALREWDALAAQH